MSHTCFSKVAQMKDVNEPRLAEPITLPFIARATIAERWGLLFLRTKLISK